MKRARGTQLSGGVAVALAAVGWYAGRRAARHLRLLGEAERRASAAAAERARADQTHQLLQVTDAALAALPLDELLVELLRRVCDGLGADAAALLLTDAPFGMPVLRAAHGFEPGGDTATLLPGIGLAARVSEKRRAIALAEAEVSSQVRLTALQEMRAVAGAPLLVGSLVIGVLEVGRREPAPFHHEDLALLQLAADRTAVAVDHAHVFERERVELETRFVPAGEGQEVGGDFYDVIQLAGDRWLLVIGDVCGKGPEAAALTAMVRYTLRAEAAHEPRPGELLGLLNDAMIAQRSDLLFCTLVCVLLEIAGERRMVTVAWGGHPMPLVIRADGRVEPPIDPGGPLVGVWGDAEFAEHRYRLLPGDMLVAYTDGLLEAHAPERILMPEGLAALASDCMPQPLDAFLRALESAALGSSIKPVRDDIATLGLAIEPGVRPQGFFPKRLARPSRADQSPNAADAEDENGAFEDRRRTSRRSLRRGFRMIGSLGSSPDIHRDRAIHRRSCLGEVVLTSSAGGRASERSLQIRYGIAGEHDLTERELPHLRGWRDSAPVRVGNGAWGQTQLDVYGELLNSLYFYREQLGGLHVEIQAFVVDPANTAARRWREADAACGRCAVSPGTTSRARCSAGWRSTERSRSHRSSA